VYAEYWDNYINVNELSSPVNLDNYCHEYTDDGYFHLYVDPISDPDKDGN